METSSWCTRKSVTKTTSMDHIYRRKLRRSSTLQRESQAYSNGHDNLYMKDRALFHQLVEAILSVTDHHCNAIAREQYLLIELNFLKCFFSNRGGPFPSLPFGNRRFLLLYFHSSELFP